MRCSDFFVLFFCFFAVGVRLLCWLATTTGKRHRAPKTCRKGCLRGDSCEGKVLLNAKSSAHQHATVRGGGGWSLPYRPSITVVELNLCFRCFLDFVFHQAAREAQVAKSFQSSNHNSMASDLLAKIKGFVDEVRTIGFLPL